jgi:hypothetical protein
MGLIGFPETSVRNYHYSLRNSPQKCSSQNAARSFLHSCGKRQYYKVFNYFYPELFEILILSSFSVHSLLITQVL